MVQVIRDKILNHLVRSLPISVPKPANKYKGSDEVPIVIVGNKSDLRPEQRQVTVEQGKKLAAEFKCASTEASARFNENVSKAFELMIGEIEKLQNPNQPAGGDKSCSVM